VSNCHARGVKRRMTPRIGRGALFRGVRAVIVGASAASPSTFGHAQTAFDSNFDSVTTNTPVDNLLDWIATPYSATTPYPIVFNTAPPSAGWAVIPIDAALPAAYLLPANNNVAIHWPFARTCEGFLRVQFDLGVSGGGTGLGPDSVMNLIFSPTAITGGTTVGGPDGPWAAIQVSWKSGSNATAQMLARHVNDTFGNKGAIDLVGLPFDIGPFQAGVTRSFRVDFGWDYFRFPSNWQFIGTPGVTNDGRPWADLRISHLVGGNWIPIVPPSAPPPYPAVSNGWVEFGTADKNAGSYGKLTDVTLGFSLYEWPFYASGSAREVYVHWYLDQGGNSAGAASWILDEVKIALVTPQAFAIMSNQIGYDTAGPQWVAMRPNSPDVRNLGLSAIADVTWNLFDSAGVSQQSFTSPSNPPGEPCFKEVANYEDFGAPGTAGTYPTVPIYWWRWEWNRITTDQAGWYVTADGHLNDGLNTPFHAQSDPFDVHPNLYYSTLVSDPSKNLSWRNGSEREAVDHPPFSKGPLNADPGGGWFDAGNENGENRSQGTFVSGFCNLLRRRRPHLSTQEIRDLIHQIQVGSEFLLKLGPSENVDFTRALAHEVTTGERDSRGHHLASAPTAEDIAGHIYHEHHTRFHRSLQAGALDRDDNKNSGNNLWMSCAALADAGRTLKPFAVTRAADYFAQAMDSRTYLYNLSTKYTKAADFFIPYRAQAMLDFLIYDYSLDPNVLLDARNKLCTDLIKFPPTASTVVGPWWTSGGLLKNSASATVNIPKQVDPSAYAAIDPLLYCIENNVADWPQSPQPHETWQQSLNDVYANWYQTQLCGTSFGNPLELGWTWNFDTPPTDFYGEQPFFDKFFAIESYGTARLAQFFGRSSAQFNPLVRLSVGTLNWPLGMHMGVIARHVQSASGIADNDLGHASASFVNGVGRHFAIQMIDALH